ncbi:hypothetical protein CWI38_0158p0020 [Hamiltosporidium tvaerminnensis]|uniref:Protein YOP1 n=3 Tax=Hamiltosporidium TaxID=1176354 RepID=A0A4Q9LBH9_9MICR|nr:hypothetical protein CWI39_2144p0010 [Hamiltosporidium magnivora]TBU05173.1 hypothetical protein CWI36_0667p0020 [Hamiltosporidium magnivora]TBU19989.1 hypothetical protein CWI38_0158p0020 [Hamiltosporidium tvaerminnensis]
MLGRLFVNTVSLIFILYNTFNFLKLKAQKSCLIKHYHAFFITTSIFLSLDIFLNPLTKIFPLFQVVKLCFILWTSIPLCSGSLFIYKMYICKIFGKYHCKIDDFIENSRLSVVSKIVDTYQRAYSLTSDGLKNNKVINSYVFKDVKEESDTFTECVVYEEETSVIGNVKTEPLVA